MTNKKIINNILFLFLGIGVGVLIASVGGLTLYRWYKNAQGEGTHLNWLHLPAVVLPVPHRQVFEDFSKPITAEAGKRFGQVDQLAFELYRGGTFMIDGKSGFAWEKSDHYGDVALIRSEKALPKTYTVSIVIGDIDYGLQHIEGLQRDPEYPEGPTNENGCYLLAITDEEPSGHHENLWWHEHRKVVIDVDNNTMGFGMPRPIFMVYFDRDNQLMAFDDTTQKWQSEWRKAVTYELGAWYRVEVTRTPSEFILRIFDSNNHLLNEGKINLNQVWHADMPDYFVTGDPHENFYQGSVKVKSISMPVN